MTFAFKQENIFYRHAHIESLSSGMCLQNNQMLLMPLKKQMHLMTLVAIREILYIAHKSKKLILM